MILFFKPLTITLSGSSKHNVVVSTLRLVHKYQKPLCCSIQT